MEGREAGMISIVIPNYNGEKYLKDCIDAIRIQTGIAYEILLIDNASTDSDYEWIKLEENIVFIKLDENYGFSKAVNEGIKRAKGEYVLLLNNDTVIYPEFLSVLRACMIKDENIFGISSKMINYHKPHLIDDAGDSYTLLGWTDKRGDGQAIERYDEPCEVFSACAGAALYRKKVFDEIGYFDENFFAYMEDVDISYRARVYGYRNVYCPEAKVLHIGSATSGSRYNAFKIKLAARNNIYVPYKNMPLIQLIINMPFLLIGFGVKYLFFSLKGFEKEYRAGIVEGIKTLGKVDKVPFKWRHFKNYLKIEWLLIKNTVDYIFSKLRR